MTPEEIKKTWAEASRKLYQPTPQEFEDMYRQKKETALERLAAKYKRFSTIGCVMVVVSLLWMFASFPFASSDTRIAVTISMMCYFATCSIWDYWFYRGVSSIDCYTMSVREVIDKAMYYRKKHLQSIMILLPFAFTVLGFLAYSMITDKYLLIGMAAGAIVGLLIGTRQYLEFMAEYKTISKE